MPTPDLTRRTFLRSAAAATALAGTALPALAQQPDPNPPNKENAVQLPVLHNTDEEKEQTPGPFLPPDQRVGFALVGLGHLTLNQILPAFAASKYCRPVALVSGDSAKAKKLAAQYGIKESSLYDYKTYDRLADNPDVKAIYIVLPNSMHEEFVVRGAKTGKHILCEKPMATNAREAERMVAACKAANVKLMIAYRQQYEPNNLALQQLVKSGRLGDLRGFTSSNSQRQGDPTQWRLKRALAGGGCLPDVGLYCLNAARFLSGQEPSEVFATTWQPKDDPRFKEVEAACQFILRFPSGYTATCTSGYDAHKSQFLRMEGTLAWAELSPAFAYHGNKLKWSRVPAPTAGSYDQDHETELQPQIPDKDQFALEMDHFADCILQNKSPKTPGEEGLRDHKIMDALYESARTAKPVKLS